MPLLNIAVPGLAQIQAGDPVWGYSFLGASAFGALLFAVSELCYSGSYSGYMNATNNFDDYYNAAGGWRTASIIGVSIWVVGAAASVAHVYLQPLLTGVSGKDQPVQFAISGDRVEFSFAWRF